MTIRVHLVLHQEILPVGAVLARGVALVRLWISRVCRVMNPLVPLNVCFRLWLMADFTYHLPFRHFNLKHLNRWTVYTVVSGVKGNKGRGRWARKRTFTTILKRRWTMRKEAERSP